jgi:hypothetical protein
MEANMRVPLRFMIVAAWLASALPVLAQVRVSITVGPPPLPVYVQPLLPGDGYIWMPGYWAWDGGYFWVPGTWIRPPAVGLLWTPGYWVWQDPTFAFIDGYWGPVVGFYGGINYGFGYPGRGYFGGRWVSDRFYYNRSVTNVNVTVVRNTYVEDVRSVDAPKRVSYNGGRDGTTARPTERETAAARDRRVPATAAQRQHAQRARTLPDLRADENEGKPSVLATARPEALRGERSGPRSESPRDPSSNARNAERSQARPAPPPTRSERPSTGENSRSPQNSRPDGGAQTERRDGETRPAPGRRQSSKDGSRDEDASSTGRTRQGKKRGKER